MREEDKNAAQQNDTEDEAFRTFFTTTAVELPADMIREEAARVEHTGNAEEAGAEEQPDVQEKPRAPKPGFLARLFGRLKNAETKEEEEVVEQSEAEQAAPEAENEAEEQPAAKPVRKAPAHAMERTTIRPGGTEIRREAAPSASASTEDVRRALDEWENSTARPARKTTANAELTNMLRDEDAEHRERNRPEKPLDPPIGPMVFSTDLEAAQTAEVPEEEIRIWDERKAPKQQEEKPDEPTQVWDTPPAEAETPDAEPKPAPVVDILTPDAEEEDAPLDGDTGSIRIAPDLDEEEAEEPRPEVTEALHEEELLPETQEETEAVLRRMNVVSTLRCVFSGILAVILLWVGLVSEGLLPAIPAMDPIGAPMAFMGANLLLLAAAVAVSFPVVRGGLMGLKDSPTADSLTAVAVAAALLQAVCALATAETYRLSGYTLMTGIAGLLLFMNCLGSRLQLNAVMQNFALLTNGVDYRGAYRSRNPELVRTLAQGMDREDPWILLNRPVDWADHFLDRSFARHSTEKRAQRMARILSIACLVCGAVLLITGRGIGAAVSGMATMACLGAPLSATLVMGVTALRLQHTASAVGAAVPGWSDIEELGGVELIQTDADQLFGRECIQLEDIRIFKGGRIDIAILCAASVLSEGCSTLGQMFRQIVVGRTDILLPLHDFKTRIGLGFDAWCENFHILVGTRELMEKEDIPLPDLEYEAKHSRNGELQILYLALSGRLIAMFTIKYRGTRAVSRRLKRLQNENIKLLVRCDDPTLTTERINRIYHLPEGFLRVMTQEQCEASAPATARGFEAVSCMYHLDGLASPAEALCAASRAQSAELNGTMVQQVSVWISLIIGALLAYTGSIGMLSLVAVLMYQAAWSALSIAFAMMKQK